jgi:Leucine-rich repeat (LRR) protein
MRVGILIVFGLFILSDLCGQTQPIFRMRNDSLEYARLDAILLKRIEYGSATQDYGIIDSAFRARMKFLEGREYFFRTVFSQDKNFTPYQELYRISNKDSITRISVLGNGRRKLPDSLYHYKNLEDLELINFRLTKVPRRLRVKRLTVYNNFPSKPLKLTKNKTITVLTIRGDEDGRLPKKYNKLKELQLLTLSRNNLKEFPNIAGCDKLKVLNLNNNNIERIDPAIVTLTNLESLSLYKNNLKEIPNELYTMGSLRSIDLYFNKIKTVAPAIANWKNVEVLYLANNELYSIPDEIGELGNLRELYVHHNRLSNLPTSIGNLTSLGVLRINNNYMVEWPEGLTHLKSLTNFDCSFNHFESLPIADLDFGKMKILSIGGNPWDPALKANIIAWVESLRENGTLVHLDNNLVR